MFLLAGSYYFYMCWVPAYLVLILISTLIDYFAGIKMDETEDNHKRKGYLVLSLFTNLGLLFLFKYFNFFSGSLEAALARAGIHYSSPLLDVILPMGISFYTFQTLSYTIDIYRKKRKAERHLGIFALYVSFFPQLVAGPIERSNNLLPQFYQKHEFDYEKVKSGLKLALWGLFKKVVIADRIAFLVDQVYNNPYDYYGIALIVATVFFAFQIYCDFSGYSDMAIGIARILGFDLMQNFNRPYFSKSVAEFWKRWHISLSTWFRDYLYISLGGNRVMKWRWYYNILLVFVISGLWHGANWTFVIWGALNGVYLLLEIWTQGVREKIVKTFQLNRFPALHKLLKISVTFSLICFAWIYFRANSLADANYIAAHLFSNIGDARMWQEVLSGFGIGYRSLTIGVLGIAFMEAVHTYQRSRNITELLSMNPAWVRSVVYASFIMGIALFGNFSGGQFIYFQF